jgi:hypothetical protein
MIKNETSIYRSQHQIKKLLIDHFTDTALNNGCFNND